MLSYVYNHERLTHSIKVALAVLLGFLITKQFPLAMDQWLIITILVVMCGQVNVGSIVQKATMRFLGTVTGSVIAILTLFIFGINNWAFIAIIILASMFFSYIAISDKSYSDSGTLGAATVVVILIGQHPTLMTALMRCIEISLGILVSAVVSLFVMPIHARNHLRRNQATTLRLLRKYYQATLIKNDAKTYLTLDEQVVKTLIKQRKLATEAGQESLRNKFNVAYFQHSLWCEKEILRSINFMHHAYQACMKENILLPDTVLQNFHEEVCNALTNMANNIEQQKEESIVLPDITSLKNATYTVTESQTCSANQDTTLQAFLFSAEILVARLEKLASHPEVLEGH